MKTLGDRIRKCRKDNKMSQKKLAEILNIQYQSVQDWERNRTKPSTGKIEKLMQIFNVTSTWLFSGEGVSPVKNSQMLIGKDKIQYSSQKSKRCLDIFEQLCPDTQKIAIKLMEALLLKDKAGKKDKKKKLVKKKNI